MELGHYRLEELLLAALKSEVDSKNIYLKLAKKTKNGLLQDKFRFLAGEEEKHREFIEDIYKNHFPDKKITLPRISPVPLPEIQINEKTPMSILLNEAMNAEKLASEFYNNLTVFN